MLKYLVLSLGVWSYGVGFVSANNPKNDSPEVSFLLGAGLGTILVAQSLVLYYFEMKKKKRGRVR